MDGFYNIALFPAEKSSIVNFTNLARQNLFHQSDQYLLGDDAMPRITLCQFISHQEKLDKIRSLINDVKTLSLMLTFENIYILRGEGLHKGTYWVGLTVRKVEPLMELQQTIY
jgi:hypothetical protein